MKTVFTATVISFFLSDETLFDSNFQTILLKENPTHRHLATLLWLSRLSKYLSNTQIRQWLEEATFGRFESRLRQTAKMNLYHVIKFSFLLSFTVHYLFKNIVSFTLVVLIRIVLNCFNLPIFHFEKILNLNLTFVV